MSERSYHGATSRSFGGGNEGRNVLLNDALNTFYLGYMASDKWERTTQIVREETRCRNYMGYPFRLTARVLLHAHPAYRVVHTTAFGIPVGDHWLDRELFQCSTTRDRSDNPLHHERTLYHEATSRSLIVCNVDGLPN